MSLLNESIKSLTKLFNENSFSFKHSVNNNDVTLELRNDFVRNNSSICLERCNGDFNGWSEIGFINNESGMYNSDIYFYDIGLKSGMYNYRIKKINTHGAITYCYLKKKVRIEDNSIKKMNLSYENNFGLIPEISF